MKKFTLFLFAMAVAAVSFAQGHEPASDGSKPKEITLTDAERELVKANNNFALRLFREARTEENAILSPLSITYALGMLNNGATGRTQQEINEVLGFGEAGADAINAFCRKMLTEAPKLDDTKVAIGNTIFVNEGMGYRLQDAFVQTVNTFYDAQPQARNFTDGKTMDVINQWASDHTNGMIKQILDAESFDPMAVSYLLNAIYFKGDWTNEFDPESTTEEPFNGGDAVPMMNRLFYDDIGYAENDLYQAVNLPYGLGAYSMSIFLPKEGKTVADILEKMTDEDWKNFSENYSVAVKLPRFETQTDQDLKEIMSNLGMPTAFIPTYADFPYFCNEQIYISLMKQVAKIKVNEQGSEAAAVTIIGEKALSANDYYATFHATRPFLYLITEQSTGVVFFIGQYMGKLAASASLPQREEQSPKAVYNLAGQRLNKVPERGIYIRNGQKVVK
ncbi:MAG: serpin family protein [Prevotella sp.]|nr:serpin family protein [Prevotella sp.]